MILQAVTFTVEYFHSLLLLKLGLTFKGAIYPRGLYKRRVIASCNNHSPTFKKRGFVFLVRHCASVMLSRLRSARWRGDALPSFFSYASPVSHL